MRCARRPRRSCASASRSASPRSSSCRSTCTTGAGSSWYGEPGPGELVDWEPVLQVAGVRAEPSRVAQAYLELAVLVRALDGLAASVRFGVAVDRSSLWAGLFDLRENLFARALE